MSNQQPNKSKEKAFSWRVYDGAEVLNLDKTPLLKRSDLLVGKDYLIPSLFGYFKMKVLHFENGQARAENETQAAWLDWDKDDRHTWTNSVTIDKKAIFRVVVD